ncbi:SDR family NAD(P)-dependent oxidoreductase [Salinactinospora qingdaonensis]|uniref:SDR family NAD(P)-dependent oxidoreductase n=1 Tax=Salinactinospora qingdaonensis TaxID=702744 RepID=A0ABP7FE89_9ACTN
MFRKSAPLPPDGKTVVITGASTGLGRECALHLAALGFTVFAGVRNPEDGKRLVDDSPSGRVEYLLIDVTDEESIRAAAEQVESRVAGDGLWALINNAGVCISAPLECVSSDMLRHQLETNVIGQVAVLRSFLPLLRRARGRVVNVTSGLGTVALPYMGPYSTAQFAKEGMSDALRRELAPMGVAVSVVSPGAIMTPIWDKISADGLAALAGAPSDVANLYRQTFVRFLRTNEEGARTSKTQPADVAKAVRAAVTAARPKTRYRVGADARQGSVLARLLPDTAIDASLRKIVTPDPTSEDNDHVRH